MLIAKVRDLVKKGSKQNEKIYRVLLRINDLSDDVIFNIDFYADDTTLYSEWGQVSDLWLLNLNLIYETLWTGAGSGLLKLMLEKLNFLCLTSLITLVPLM